MEASLLASFEASAAAVTAPRNALSVVQDLRDIAGNRSFKHVYICSRRRLSPVAKASAKELSASYSARGSIPAASAVEYHSVRTPAVRRSFLVILVIRGVVCLTHHPLTGVTACWCVKHTNPSSAQVFRKYVSQSVGDLESEARTRPAPGPFSSDVTQFDLTDGAGQ